MWCFALVIAFLLHRGEDVGRLGGLLATMLARLASGHLVGLSGLGAAAGGVLIAALIVTAWLGLGDLILRLPGRGGDAHDTPWALRLASRGLAGAIGWGMLWLGLGIAHLYRGWVAAGALVVGVGLAGLRWRCHRPTSSSPSPLTAPGRLAIALVVLVLSLALVAALAPPTARDALFYHFALPKAYLAAGGHVMVPYNLATFYPQGVEMQVVWGMLLGRLAGGRTAETAAGVTVFAFAVLLALVTYGWARERGIDRTWASLATLMVVAIPTVYDLAGSGYVDLALAAYTALAVRTVGRWWSTLDRAWTVPLAVAVAGVLSIKLTAGFLVLALGVVVLVRAAGAGLHRGSPAEAGPRLLMTGAGGLLLGALAAAPWYLRTWARTGSPVFPFYLDIWPGAAPGWDVARSRLYQSLLSTYGDPQGVLDYVLAPVRLALSAQPDEPARYDGVLGIAFLFALPLLVWALARRRLDAELRIAVLISTAMFLFWLFSSQQLRFLLPALPALAVAMSASGMAAEAAAEGRLLRWTYLGAAAVGLLVILAWFASLDPARAALGGEPPAAYLARRLDYYPYYEYINQRLSPAARVWLINMRRDTYHLDRPYFSDFVFEDYTLAQWVREASSADEIRARARAAGITHLLVRHDVLFDYARSPVVDDRLSREQNVARLRLLLDFFQNGTRLLRGDQKFWLIELPR